jgi:hypothetical protein
MRRLVGAIALALSLAACAPTTTATPAPPYAPEIEKCEADVAHANLNVHDVTALDFAIHDCPSLFVLIGALSAAPGYLNASTTVEEFVRNRCDDPKAVFAGLKNPVCDEAPPLQRSKAPRDRLSVTSANAAAVESGRCRNERRANDSNTSCGRSMSSNAITT